MATLIMKTQKTFHLRQELQLAWNRREFCLLPIPLFSPLTSRVPSAPSLLTLPALCSALRAECGAGDGRWGQGGTRAGAGLTAQHFGALLSSHRAQMSNGCGARSQPQILILQGLIVEMSCTSVQNERRAFSF